MKSSLEKLTFGPGAFAELTPDRRTELSWRLATLPVFEGVSELMIVRPEGGGTAGMFGLGRFIELSLLAGVDAVSIVQVANAQAQRNAYEAAEVSPVQGVELAARHDLPGGGYLMPLHGDGAKRVLGRCLADELYELGFHGDGVAFVQPVSVNPALVDENDAEAFRRDDHLVSQRRHRRRVLECALALVVPTAVSLRGWTSFAEANSIYDFHQITGWTSRYVKPAVIPATFDPDELNGVVRSIDAFDPATVDKLLLAADRLVRSRANSTHADRALDLGIAQEVLLINEKGDGKSEVTQRLASRSAWLLGVDPASRRVFMDRAKGLYGLRSAAAHTGAISFGRFKIPAVAQNAIDDADALVVETLRVLLARGRFPDWESLVLGGLGL